MAMDHPQDLMAKCLQESRSCLLDDLISISQCGLLHGHGMPTGPDGQVPPEIEKLDPKIVEMVCNEILDSGSSTGWDDIAGLENAKKLVHEIIVWPMQNPQLFKVRSSTRVGMVVGMWVWGCGYVHVLGCSRGT
eukprot:1160865-Pelagomonas_calceolata.AAC.1